MLRLTAVLALLSLAAPLDAARMAGQATPRPETRALLDAFVAALNSESSETWEAMAAAHFTPELLAKRSAAERRDMHRQLREEFGRITLGDVRRRGPDAPLVLTIEGSTGTMGTIELHLTGFRINAIGIEVGGSEGDLPAPPIHGRMTADALTAALDPYLATLTADDRFSGVVLIAKDGKQIFAKAYGLADRANQVPNTTATRFNLGSLNKIFTQAAIAQLVTKEKVSYAAQLGAFLPDYPQAMTRTATIEQLLDHSAGVADFFGPAFDNAPKDQFRANADYYRLVSSLPALFAPGTRRQYCNGCYITLGAIIERAAGVPYEQYVAENIFRPAGMTGAGYPPADSIAPNIAEGYTRRMGGELRRNIYTRGAAGSAAGGGYATAADLLAFDNALREGRLVDAAGLRRIFRGEAIEPGKRVMGGLGVAGGAPGINAILDSNGVWTVVVLSNLDPPSAENLGPAIMRALTR